MAILTGQEVADVLGLGTLAAATEPISSTSMTALVAVVEGYADAKIRAQTGNTLAVANTVSNSATEACLIELCRKYYLAQQTARAGAASSSSSEGSKSYAGSMRWDPEIGVLIGLASSGGSPYVVKSSVDETNLSGG